MLNYLRFSHPLASRSSKSTLRAKNTDSFDQLFKASNARKNAVDQIVDLLCSNHALPALDGQEFLHHTADIQQQVLIEQSAAYERWSRSTTVRQH
jgi:hypothetical protein